jgi:hypothetical protein
MVNRDNMPEIIIAFLTVERPENAFSINYAIQQTLEIRPTKVI